MPMALGMKCFNCGKGIMIGHNVSHAKNRTRKVFKPNLHSARIILGGTPMRVKLCTKCLRLVKGTVSKKALKSNKVSSIAPAASGLV